MNVDLEKSWEHFVGICLLLRGEVVGSKWWRGECLAENKGGREEVKEGQCGDRGSQEYQPGNTGQLLKT